MFTLNHNRWTFKLISLLLCYLLKFASFFLLFYYLSFKKFYYHCFLFFFFQFCVLFTIFFFRFQIHCCFIFQWQIDSSGEFDDSVQVILNSSRYCNLLFSMFFILELFFLFHFLITYTDLLLVAFQNLKLRLCYFTL